MHVGGALLSRVAKAGLLVPDFNPVNPVDPVEFRLALECELELVCGR